MIALGLRLRTLGTEELTWRDLKAVVACTPPDSALSRARRPRDHQWQLGQLLLADIADSLRWLVWAKTKDAQRGRNRPDRIARPGVKSTAERYGSAALLADMNQFLGWSDQPSGTHDTGVYSKRAVPPSLTHVPANEGFI